MGRVKELDRSKVVIRPYTDADQLEIERLFVQGTMEGPGSPLTEALAAYRPRVALATSLLVLGFFCELIFLDRPLGVLLEDPAILLRQGGPLTRAPWIIFLYSASVGLYVHAFLMRRALRAFLDWFVAGGLVDLQSIPETYNLEAQASDHINPIRYYLSTRPGGFWIAELEGKIAGFVGLKVQTLSTSPSPPSAQALEVSRLIVSQEWRGHRIGQILMDEVEAHARAMGLTTLELMTSTFFHTAANKLYKRNGWAKVREIVKLGVTIQVLQKTL